MEKPWKSFEEQKRLLEARGLEDTQKLLADLEHYGYYRLSGYWHIFRKEGPPSNSKNKKSNSFKPGTSYTLTHNLVVFDERLRKASFTLLMDFELRLRTYTAYIMGKRGPF